MNLCEGKETDSQRLSEMDLALHTAFVDLSLENDLKKEEMEWFRSKIGSLKVEDKQQKTESGSKKVDIIVEYEPGKPSDKPSKVFLKLSETETIWLFSLTSSCEDNAEDIEKVVRENQTYEMKKTKKEIIRKRCTGDAQTPCRVVKSTGVLTTEIIMQDTGVFASEWDLYDTYNALGKCEAVPSKSYLKCGQSTKSLDAESSAEDSVSKVFRSSPFRYASLVTERLLASNSFQSKQSVFKKHYRTRYDLEPTLFTYTIEPLWSFQKELETPLAVTSMDWNPLNKDLLAVAYGDLTSKKKSLGLVCVWSSKNPRQPEKQFHLEDSVTSVHYSRVRPNVLAAATRKGNVYVLDVSSEDGKSRLLGSSEPYVGPIWKVEWLLVRELVQENERLLAVGEGGMLKVFSTSTDENTKDVLKLEYVTSTKKFPEKIDKKEIYRRPVVFHETFDKKIFSGLCFSICGSRNFCYISTKEGVVLKCNLRNPSLTNGSFLAHDGPVYIIQHSPVTDFIYLTCGADWNVKIWMEGINQPLITLQQKAPVTCARWSPTIPTLIASVAEKELSLWDIARNVLSPMSKRNFHECGKTCNFLFSSNGAVGGITTRPNVMIGSEDGLVHVVHLSELPRIPFLQKEALIAAIRRALSRNKDELYVKFCKTVEANRAELKTQVLSQLYKL